VAPDQAERRLAAIMFTDIVGSTALTARSESAGLALRDRHRELVRNLVSRYHGRFIEAPGDESLSTFASAVDAVHAALAIQQDLRGDLELRVRVGIHTGETMFRGDEVFGDGVNISARVRELADPGQILVSGEVARSIQNQPNVEISPRGEHPLKGVEGSVMVHEVSGSAAEPGRAPKAVAPPRRAAGPRWTAAGVAALLALVALAWWSWNRAALTPAPIRSLAVLPLENLSGDAEQEFFADGMTDALIGDLAKIGSFRVISRTSVMRHKDTQLMLPEVARELEADAIVEGSVLRAGNRVRITAQLIDARSDTHLWAESYERDLRNILALQAEVAQAIAREIAHELSPRARARFTPDRAIDPVAYDATLKGLQLVWSFTPSDHARSLAYFNQAIRADPTYAPAYAGLAAAYT
jgi:TolB-like protein/class 3 adenylate cyclase